MSRFFSLRKRSSRVAATATLAGLLAGSVWLRGQLSDTRQVSSLLPAGGLLYLEAKDFRASLREWTQSSEQKRWLASRNYQELSISRLLQRLEQAGGEFAKVAGTPVNLSLTGQLAGARSGFAFYDFSSLTFVYLTQMGQSQIEATGLWQGRTSFQAREVAGIPFFVKEDAATTRRVAFAAYQGWLAVATDENRLAAALRLLSGEKGPSIATEPWFQQAAGQRPMAGTLRLAYNLSALIAAPQFRTYWLHRNASELKPFSAGVSDLLEQENSFEEQRLLVRKASLPSIAPDPSLAQAASYAPADASLVRDWSSPDAARVTDAVQQVITGQPATSQRFHTLAPDVSPEAGVVGSESDLEIRIDEPPFERPSQLSVTPLVTALMAMQPLAMAHVQSTALLRDQVFVLPQSGVVLWCRQPDRLALDRALAQVSTDLQTGQLDPLHVALEGQAIVLSRMDLKRGSSSLSLAPDVTYMASYNHHAAWPHYTKLFAMIDGNTGLSEPGVSANTPAFFAGNLQSLGDTLSRLQRASILSSDAGATVRETIRYQLEKP